MRDLKPENFCLCGNKFRDLFVNLFVESLFWGAILNLECLLRIGNDQIALF